MAYLQRTAFLCVSLCVLCIGCLATATMAGEPPATPAASLRETRHPSPVLHSSSLAEAAATPSPYGACAHVAAHGEFEGLDSMLGMMVPTGVANIRCDFTWANIEKPKGKWDFSLCDEVVAKARAAGVTILPILDYTHSGHGEPHLDPGPWREYVRRVAERYAADCPVFEVWNEPDHGKEIYPEPAEGGGYTVAVSGNPVFFVGGTLEME